MLVIGMNDIKLSVGQQIREARKQKGLTQKELAEKLGISEAAVYRYEQGQNFTVETLYRISQVVGVTVEKLVKGF